MARHVCPSLTFALVVAIFATLATSFRMVPGLPLIVDGLRLYRKLADANVGKNLLMSPVGISTAMTMLSLGAEGSTKTQIERAIRISRFDRRDLPYMMYYMYGGSNKPDPERFSVPMGSLIYGPAVHTFKDAYRKKIWADFSFWPKELDFKGDLNHSRQVMKGEVQFRTQYKVNELFPEGSITNDTKLVLGSAVTLRAVWWYTFRQEATRLQTFHLSNGTEIKVPMMECGPSWVHHYANNTRFGFEVLKIGYYNIREVIYFVLPHENQTLASVDNLLETTNEWEILRHLSRTDLKITIPKFTLQQSLDLKEALKSAGIVDAFDVEKANFSRLSDSGNLVLSKVMHGSSFTVDEIGTGFNGNTYYCTRVSELRYKLELIDFTLDRPFLFLVLDEFTRSLIFRGRVMNPLEGR